MEFERTFRFEDDPTILIMPGPMHVHPGTESEKQIIIDTRYQGISARHQVWYRHIKLGGFIRGCSRRIEHATWCYADETSS